MTPKQRSESGAQSRQGSLVSLASSFSFVTADFGIQTALLRDDQSINRGCPARAWWVLVLVVNNCHGRAWPAHPRFRLRRGPQIVDARAKRGHDKCSWNTKPYPRPTIRTYTEPASSTWRAFLEGERRDGTRCGACEPDHASQALGRHRSSLRDH